MSSPMIKIEAGILAVSMLLLVSCGDHSVNNDLVPNAPGQFHATALSATRVYMSWTDNSSNETGFDILRRPIELVFWTRVARLPANTVTCIDSTVADTTTYMYYALAFNSTGNSDASQMVIVTTPAIGHPPEAPYNPIPWNGGDSVSLTPTLFWSASDPDGDSLIYDVKLGLEDFPEVIRHNWTDTSLALTFPPLRADTVYHWQVIAIDIYNHRTASPIWWFKTISP